MPNKENNKYYKTLPHVASQAKNPTSDSTQEFQITPIEKDNELIGSKDEQRNLTENLSFLNFVQITLPSSPLHTLLCSRFHIVDANYLRNKPFFYGQNEIIY